MCTHIHTYTHINDLAENNVQLDIHILQTYIRCTYVHFTDIFLACSFKLRITRLRVVTLFQKLNFIKISCRLTDVCGIKSTGSSKIFILTVWKLRKVVTRSYSFLIQHIITRERRSLNFAKISLRLTDIFFIPKICSVGNEVYILGLWGLETQCSDFHQF